MARLALSMMLAPNDRVGPIVDGTVQPDGIDLMITTGSPGEVFYRQLHGAEFDVSEMSFSELLMLTARGDSPWVAIPIFPQRHFFHTYTIVRADAGIEQPADLKGKRVGVPEYVQTGALWTRGVLQHEFGVLPTDLDWHMERLPELSHAGAGGFRPPLGLRFQHIPPDKTNASMLVSGELDAVVFYVAHRTMLDRSGVDLSNHPRVRPLFPDPLAEGVRYYRKTGFFPINHTFIVRRSIYERHPWVAINLYKAFLEAKQRVQARTRELADPYFRLGLLPAEARAGLDVDPFPYGVQANRCILETIASYSHEQGLTPRVVALEEIFAPSTLSL